MEPVGSTYAPLLTVDVPAAGSARGEQGKSATSGTLPASGRGLGRGTEPYLPDQQGVQLSKQPADEFRPYTRAEGYINREAGTESAPPDDAAGTEAQDPRAQAEIVQLKATEEKVKAHEAAHKSAGGTITGPVSYTYTRGPDGRSYITGGEVPINISTGRTPQETIRRMQQVIQAALAPGDPSPQDRAVAAQATAQLQEASRQLAELPQQATTETSPGGAPESHNQTDNGAGRAAERAYGNSTPSGAAGGSTRPVSYYA